MFSIDALQAHHMPESEEIDNLCVTSQLMFCGSKVAYAYSICQAASKSPLKVERLTSAHISNPLQTAHSGQTLSEALEGTAAPMQCESKQAGSGQCR